MASCVRLCCVVFWTILICVVAPPGHAAVVKLRNCVGDDLRIAMWTKDGSAVEASSRDAVRRAGGECLVEDRSLTAASFVLTTTDRIGFGTFERDGVVVDMRPVAFTALRLRTPDRSLEVIEHAIVELSECASYESQYGRYHLRHQNREAIKIPVAAGCSTLTLTVDDYVPVVVPSIEVGAGATQNLGERELQTGGALFLKVLEEGKDVSPLGARVRIFDVARLSGKTLDALGEIPADAEGVVDSSGQVYLSPISPGRKVITVVHHRKWPDILAELEIEEGQLARQAVEVPESSSAEIGATLSDEWREAGAELYGVRATRKGEYGMRDLTVDEKSRGSQWLIGALPPGNWTFQAVTRFPGTSAVMSKGIDATLVGGTTSTLTIELSEPLYRGRIVSRGEGVAASVTLLPNGEAGAGYSFETPADGKFGLYLRKPGQYRANLQLVDERGIRSVLFVPNIEVKSPETEIVIPLPGGRIKGLVFDGSATIPTRVVAQAMVATNSGLFGVDNQVEADRGAFELDHLSPGWWTLRAESDAGLESESIAVLLAENQLVEGLELRLTRTMNVTGAIVDANGFGVPGAVISVKPKTAVPGLLNPTRSARSDREGHFRVTLPATFRASQLDIVASHSGKLATAVALADQPVVIALPSVAGGVELQLPVESNANSFERLIAPNGVLVPLAMSPVDVRGNLRTVSGLSPGRWQYVSSNNPSDAYALIAGIVPRGVRTAVFNVQPAVTVRVRVD